MFATLLLGTILISYQFRRKIKFLGVVLSIVGLISAVKIYYSYQIYLGYMKWLAGIIIVLFTGVYIIYGEKLFNYIWSRDLFKIKSDWKSVKDIKLLQNGAIIISVGLFISFIVHGLNMVGFFALKNNIEFIHHLILTISMAFLLILFIESLKKNLKQNVSKIEMKKLFAKTFFYIMILFFIFDILLESYKIADSHLFNLANLSTILLNVGFLFFAVKSDKLAKMEKIKK
ncbi:MAG: hypothetical protein ACOCRX_05780 [Candidatus Woesearchaeota archaeon]